jgi:phage shock protein E
MRTILTFLTVSCLVTGCSNQTSQTETAGAETGTSQAESDPTSESVETPTTTVAPKRTDATTPDSKPLVIDVRTQAEWDEGHLEIATHIPLDEISDRIGEVAPNKDQKVYLHCRSGGRSGQAKDELEGLGYTSVENVGGLDDARARFESGKD